jgi:Pyridoxamine 5'-phosphate oxidase
MPDDDSGDDTAWLQDLIDRSHARAGEHTRSILRPERQLTAAQVVRYFAGTVRHLALATVSPRGEPRVAPVDGLMFHARLLFSTDGRATRIRHLRANPAVSATHFVGDDLAVIAHGTAVLHEPGDDRWDELMALYREVYDGTTPADLTDLPVCGLIEPHTFLTYAPDGQPPPTVSCRTAE